MPVLTISGVMGGANESGYVYFVKYNTQEGSPPCNASGSSLDQQSRAEGSKEVIVTVHWAVHSHTGF